MPGSANFPAARSSASPSPPLWSAIHAFFFSTSRPPDSIRRAGGSFGRSSAPSRKKVAPCCSPRTIWMKPNASATAFTTHYMDEAERLCDRLAIVDHGEIIAEGTPSDLIDRLGGHHVVEFQVSETSDDQ